MDLSQWIEPVEPKTPEIPDWIDLSQIKIPDGCPAASSIRIERCLGAEDATLQLGNLDILGVYCLTLGENQEIFGLEPWRPDAPAPEARD